MSAYTEQEELEKFKTWWKSYGNALILGVILGAGLLFGNKYWQQYQERRIVEAATLYDELRQHYQGNRPEPARAAGTRLLDEYASTPYAAMAALMLARHGVVSGDGAAARKHLQWVLDHAADTPLAHAARLRLARLLAGEGKHEAALAQLDVKEMSGFEAEYLEARGDVLTALGRAGEARAAYSAALKAAENRTPYRQTLGMKLDDLGQEATP
ncbi:MAG: hypothetical protein A3B81_00400 [Candidatus Muproteobacteria bacterium RIFCSPHIGHO2_02_FULL_65_16]|uniref:Ancillary SecYEG translocon subunit n=1 Tax=Candidatus Muproteobacteria bacterium RIFCSPHIGHO2_02_FULL_65_16 TaxID=1817766 RepID=A0A1F6TXY7_9PROT|nr:MAG: hypothetical protein A3B81_00400 [Candidatus Muproteobacteria bacterium RIFCSPHIGHO2_02_FULL_65_16]